MLSAGSKLGPYEIVGAIGAGGMGEVYRARDAKLGRDVALKVLPEALARDAERMARFQREAKVLASLNHPNIAAIYGLEDSGATHALVMELVEGPTLADRIKSGPIPVDEALPIAKQIAEALEYAHERGIVHRDLKPANVKVSRDGAVKVLDFGLAKAVEGEAVANDMANSPTITRMATQAGLILGTAAYMSPEQAKGKPVDRRADIWAFGCVLYEMLTGKTSFGGETVTDILAAVVRAEPDWSQLPAGNAAPRARAFAALLAERSEAAIARHRRRAHFAGRNSLGRTAGGAHTRRTRGCSGKALFGWIPAAIVAIPLLLLAALAFVHFRETPSADPVLNLSVSLPGNALALRGAVAGWTAPGHIALQRREIGTLVSLSGFASASVSARH